MRWYPSKEIIAQSWEKYGLIVVGNIVFFALLYFISYRPHNEENRAGEFLSMAQMEETEGNSRTAMVLYKKILTDYDDTRAAETAKFRVDYINNHKKQEKPEKPKTEQPIFDLKKMLNENPSVFLAKFLAKKYMEHPKLKKEIKGTIENYLRVAVLGDGILLNTLKKEKEFQLKEFQESFFALKSRCSMKSDWVYDDFSLKNTSIFPWHNVRIQMTVSQGGNHTKKEVRVPLLRPGQSVEVLSFHVQKRGGDVVCKGKIKAREGKVSFYQKL